jgi:ferredoxin
MSFGPVTPSRWMFSQSLKPKADLGSSGVLVPKLTVESYGTFDVAEGKRLVLAVEHDAGVDILHACGGNARCTTCRVEFIAGEPVKHTQAERERLAAKQLTGVRLSCQILCDYDMTIRAISRLQGSGRPDPGPEPSPEITPPAVWEGEVGL